jgi:hypothetical protein
LNVEADHEAVSVLVDKVVERRGRGLLAMEEACFGSREPEVIWSRVSEVVERVLRVPPIGVGHYSVSIGAVLGLHLADDRRVALKVFAPWHDPTFLAAANRVRRTLVAEGYPAPRPLSDVESLAAGHAWIEEWIDLPAPACADDIIAPLARHLAELMSRCAGIERDGALQRSWQTFDAPVGIWRNPPRPDADLNVEVDGADWVRDIAERGRAIAEQAPGPKIVGHIDWRPDNVRVNEDGSLAAVLDWDSVQLTHRVHMLAGACASLSPENMAAFLDSFQTAAETELSVDERRAVAGRVVWSRASLARYELVRGLPEAELRIAPHLTNDADAYLAAV